MPLLVFTDLDGTLLSHSDYRWDAALPALKQLEKIGAGVILASSKTAPEIHQLREDMGLHHWPAIVENGSGRLEAQANAGKTDSIYARLCSVARKISANTGGGFRGFGDMDAREVSDITGLPVPSAALAKQRSFSEPGVWSGTAQEKENFLLALAKEGISGREGGRFLTLSFGGTKADQMERIIAEFAPHHTLALGDAPNDVEMLEAADFGVIIANPNRTPLPLLKGETSGRIQRTTLVGPEGWNAAVLAHIERMKL
ncbi:HAD-IIB family hydrolase [Sulfitobacter donghicola]|nr:HAD hydrolase family protein [Sulfitobacter donghicola]